MIKIILKILLLLLYIGCTPEVIPLVYAPEASTERTTLSLELKDGSSMDTKSPMLEGSETVRSGAMVAVYYTSTGLMDSVQEIPSSMEGSISLPMGQEVEIFVLGNLWAIDKSSGEKTNIAHAYAEYFPASISELKSWEYRLTGGDINADYRQERLSEVAVYGIPFSGSTKLTSYGNMRTLTISCKRLFSKISLCVDHSGLDGGKNVDYFRNVSLHLRQANALMKPFADLPVKAMGQEDVIEGDYDPAMTNGSRLVFDFYVPENMQGTLLPGNTDPSAKDYDDIVARYGKELAGLLTYVEFAAEVNPDAGGYGGDVVYRFYLGADNCSNFDLERNRCYNIELDFKVNSLFDPDWKVNSQISDNREIGICADAARTRLLPSGQLVAVRKNRPGKVYPYVIAGQGNAVRKPDGIKDPSYSPADLSECAFAVDFQGLDAMGISAVYEAESGLITFSVTDQSKFSPGEEIELTLTTVPEGKSSTFVVRSYDDISVEWDRSVTRDFVPGMSRTASLSGFSSEVSYRSTTEHCYKDEAVPGQEGVISSSYSANPVISGNSFKLYNFACCIADVCMESTLYFRPVDDFNDGNNDGVLDDADAFACRIVNRWPDVEFIGSNHPRRIELDVAGNEEDIYLEISMRADYGTRMLSYSDFDKTIFDMVYQPHLYFSSGASELKDADGNTLYQGDEDIYIGLRRTENKYYFGWPVYEIYRNRIGDRYSTRQAVTYVNYYIAYMPSLHKPGTFYAKLSDYMDIAFLPFLSKDFDADFADAYHDYTLWNSQYLDYEYRILAENSVSATSGKNVQFGLKNNSTLKLYAKAMASTEADYSDNGISQSISISQESTGGPLRMSFVETGSNNHTAGPHNVYASITNKHSGESREEFLGDFRVYIHFIAGLMPEIDGVVDIYPEFLSDASRCSYWDVADEIYPSIWIKSASTFHYSSFNEPPGAAPVLTFAPEIGVVGDRSSASKLIPEDLPTSLAVDPITRLTPECPYDQGMNYQLWQDAYFFLETCKDYPATFCELIHKNGNYEFRFDDGSAVGTNIYKATAWADLKDPAAEGYYHFHFLGDLRGDCGSWVPLFDRYAGL